MRKWNQSSRAFACRPFRIATIRLGSRSATSARDSRARLSSTSRRRVFGPMAESCGFWVSAKLSQPQQCFAYLWGLRCHHGKGPFSPSGVMTAEQTKHLPILATSPNSSCH
jgi:hypothetical protein